MLSSLPREHGKQDARDFPDKSAEKRFYPGRDDSSPSNQTASSLAACAKTISYPFATALHWPDLYFVCPQALKS
ncbi:hypothetical protein EDE11_12342 [Methylomonas methanica]|uniref:Uncharacterized protein n=1 Tax=Methylomonas methanica TaxID=421 RepID=A0ABY2CLF5_METMH|nr:hypothetical protein EDE11_12342 [Methylomonas methanica]